MHYLKVHFYCEQCDQKFDDKKAILDHQDKVHNKLFQCELCQKCYFDGGNLNSHKILAHSTKTNDEKKKYYCDLCEFVTKERRDLVDHNVAIHLKKKDFSCDKCDFATATKGSLRKHQKRKHQISPSIKCDLCDYTFKNALHSDLLSHMKTHQTNRPLIKCEHCSKEFLTKGGLNSHVKLIHCNERYKCDICHVKSRNVTLHKIHMRIHFPVEEQYKCDKCDTFVTNNKYRLTTHIKTNHSTLKNVHLECTVCKKQFTSFADHRAHMWENHKGSRIACTFCSEDFRDIWTWKMHLLRSHFQCHKCNGKFDTEESILSHMKDEHNDEYKCDQCSKQYFERKHLIRHKKQVHENIRAKKRYPCDSCEYVATIPSQLKYHMEHKHVKNVMYHCDICDYQTSWKSHLTRHVHVVHNKENLPVQTCHICEFSTVNPKGLQQHMSVHCEKQFQCDVCETGFTTSASLRQHMETFHKGELMHCDLCEFETRQKSAFDRHWSVHEKLSIKTCEVCEYSTTNKYMYERHVQKHSDFPPSFKCEYCEKVLTTQEGIRAHVKSIHKRKNNESKAKVSCHLCERELTPKLLKLHLARIHTYCKQCDQKFQTSNEILDHLKEFHELDFQCNICFTRHFCIETLRTHINNAHNSHTGLFKCDICEYTTNKKIRLEEHCNAKHSEKRMYQCDLCDWKTAYSKTLKEHMKRMHSTREAIFQCDIAKCNYSSTEIQHLKAHKKSLKHQENLRKIQLTNQNGQWVVQLKRFRS